MGELEQAIRRRLEELKDPANLAGDVTSQVNIRVDAATVAVLDYLVEVLRTTRSGAAHFLVTNSMYDALRELNADLGVDPQTGEWVVYDLNSQEAEHFALQAMAREASE